MAILSSHRSTREWPLLILALALVCAICIPLWQWSVPINSSGNQWAGWTPERFGRLLLGPEQIACYCAFTWAGFILLSRYLEMRRQRKAFDLGFLPSEDGLRILPEDARPLVRKLEQITSRKGPFLLANMIRLGLSKYAASRSAADVGETVRQQAEVDQSRLATSMATVQYLAWALPALGFIGTVRGLASSLTMAPRADEDVPAFFDQTTRYLTVAFDTTLIALLLSLVLMFLLHSVQRDEEGLVIDCQQYCLENLVNRLYDPEPQLAYKD
jgi:hypothetical protein